MTNATPWRFYGREKEVARLTNGLQIGTPLENRLFLALRVRGRRGVGKTDLLKQMKARAPHDMPVVIQEMRGPESQEDKRPSTAEIKRYVKDTNHGLLAQAGTLGLVLPDPCRPPDDDLHHEWAWFRKVLTELLKAGTVVVLDEFHHAAPLGLHHQVKQVIDTARGSSEANRKWPGKIVVMGSHQQKVDAMFTEDQPLYNRIGSTYLLNPWRLSTLMKMAAEQGILASPEKFLTLFTAYGGLPRHWERYCVEPDYAPLHDITDDREWRQEWLAVEQDFLANDERERWDAKAYVELPRKWRDLLLWIGARKPRGVTIKDIPNDLGQVSHEEKVEALHQLRHWVKLVDTNTLVGEQGVSRWFISDLNTLYQIHVFREYETIIKGVGRDQEPPTVAALGRYEASGTAHRKHMESLEGEGLEVMAAAFLSELAHEGGWSGLRVWHPAVPGDIDAMATRMKPGQEKIWLGSAKRNEKDHEPAEDRKGGKGLAAMKEQQDRFMDALIASAINRKDQISADNLTHAERARVLFSRLFSPELRQEYQGKGFEPVDIHDIARSFGLDPAPHVTPKHAQVATPAANDQEDEPGSIPEPLRPPM